ncbi:MAG TPA: hypothetical protein VJP88_09930, partial [Caulobacteraceae bacterium]|nr:hypothetical protein [Caulobacteraceae bacterium]
MRRWAGLQVVVMTCAFAAAAQAGELKLSPYAVAPSDIAPQDSMAALFSQSSPSGDAAAVNWRSTQAPLASHTRLRVSLADPAEAP